MAAKPRQPDAEQAMAEQAALLDARYGHLAPVEVIERAAERYFAGEIAAVSSFGADSAVLLHMIAGVDALVSDLGLTDIRVITPLEAALIRDDPDGRLHRSDTEGCCAIRKVEPMARGVEPFKAWFTGRKRYQAETRAALPVFEAVGPRARINPLARWTTADLAGYMRAHRLRENPLVAYGYLSIGCFPCTQPVKPGEDARSGRWAGQAKTECGIHLTELQKSLPGASC